MGTRSTIKVERIFFATSPSPTASFPAGGRGCIFLCALRALTGTLFGPGVETKVGCLLLSHGWRGLW